MSEIDFVVDVRQSPDTPELIVSKQKVAFSGDARLVGSLVESRVGLVARKAKVSIVSFAEAEQGFVVVARVENVGAVPFEITRVAFEHRYKQPQQVGGGAVVAEDREWPLDLFPIDQARTGPLQPGEERGYYLPQILYDNVASTCVSLPPDQLWVAVYSGTEEVGRIGGEHVQLFFERASVVFHRRAVPFFDTLPEADRLAVIRAVAPLRNVKRDQWPSAGAVPLDGTPLAFLVRAGEDLGVVVQPTEDKKVEVADIVREGALEQFEASGGGPTQ